MKKEYMLKILVIIINLIVVIRLFDIMIINHEEYKSKGEEIVSKTIYSSSAPRGRILDKMGNILVDNKGIKVLTYKNNGDNQIELCKYLASILDMSDEYVSENDLKKYYYMANKQEIDKRIGFQPLGELKSWIENK